MYLYGQVSVRNIADNACERFDRSDHFIDQEPEQQGGGQNYG